MSSVPAPAKAQKSKKEKDKDKEKKPAAPSNERLKSVVRRLPPNIPEDIFWQSVQPWVTEETVTWKIFYPGKLQKKLNKENVPSRAYIAFKNEEQLALFSREYDGHIFRDKTGAESQAVVEFAPYPKIPSEKRKPDNRNGTIEKDEDYISFVESLKASENVEPVSLESLIASSQPPPPPKTTPLLEALKAEKSANRDKEAILRNHAHYSQITGGPSRKDDKKKAAPPAPAAKPAESVAAAPSAGGGKKAGKKVQGAVASAPNLKNAAATQAFKDAPAGNLPANQSGKPVKPPRAPRLPQAKQAANANTALPNLPVIAVPPAQVAATSVPSPITEGQTPTGAAAPPRRTRPMLGLGSRQFEAALNGVAGLASAATERKRREKEKEVQALTQVQNAATGPAASPSTSTVLPLPPVPSVQYARIDGSDTDKPVSPAPPPSPKRNRRGGRGGGAGAGGMGGSAPSGFAEVPQVRVPSILQRADAPPPGIIQKEALGAVNDAPVAANPAGNNPRGGGGGRRGRGGGRGRGGAPNAPRGG